MFPLYTAYRQTLCTLARIVLEENLFEGHQESVNHSSGYTKPVDYNHKLSKMNITEEFSPYWQIHEIDPIETTD